VKLLGDAPPGSALAGAAMSSALPHLANVSASFAESADSCHDAIVGDLFRCAIAAKNDEVIVEILAHTNTRPRLAGLLEALNARGLSLVSLAASMKSSPLHMSMKSAQERLTQDLVKVSVAKVRQHGGNAGLEDLQLLAADPDHHSEVSAVLPALWEDATAQSAPNLLSLIARLQPGDAPKFLLTGWSERTPAMRGQIIETLLSNDAWTLALLDRIKNRQVEANACDAATRARLVKHPKAEVKKLASAVFADSGSAARGAVVEKFKPALGLKGDAANGKAVFAQVCISCHKLDGVGLELGPDLRSVAQHDGEKLLNSILDPSAIIEPGFMAYHCTLKNGEQLYGVVATETSTSLTLKLPGNVTRAVLRSDIASLKSTNTSLMPDGLEAVMTAQSLADLIAYLKMARQ
jgi:putative heme-binding domain-containing protein